MNLIYFSDWWDNILNHDKIYIDDDEKKLYGIIICFSKTSITNYLSKKNLDLKEIKNVRPIYPWKEEIKNHLLFFK